MKSEWRVSANPVGGEYLYIVYRLRNINDIDHSGNREYYGSYTEDKSEAQSIADRLNAEENNHGN